MAGKFYNGKESICGTTSYLTLGRVFCSIKELEIFFKDDYIADFKADKNWYT